MRTFALAQAWMERGGESALLTSSCPEPLRRLVEADGVRVRQIEFVPGSEQDAAITGSLASETGAWVVLDGYHFCFDYQKAIRAKHHRVLLMDDSARPVTFSADVLVNQNAHAESGNYSGSVNKAKLLLGTSYALLRRGFANRWNRFRPVAARARTLLVVLGGMDSGGITQQALSALDTADNASLAVTVLTGFRSAVQLPERRFGAPWRAIRAQEKMDSLLAVVDIAISTAGSTCWEMACVGVPMVLLTVASNQEPIAQSLEESGAAVSLGYANSPNLTRLSDVVAKLTTSYKTRQAMAEAGRALVDGLGAQRVVAALWPQSA